MWIVYAIGAAMVWGLEYALLDRILGQKVAPIFLLALQMTAGAVTFGLVCAFSGRMFEDAQHAFSDSGAGLLIVVSLVSFTLANLLIILSIRDGSALLAGLIEMTYPIFIVLFSMILFGHSGLSVSTVLGGLLIMSGIGVLKATS